MRKGLLIWLLFCRVFLVAEDNAVDIFTHIYQIKKWGKGSGGGSSVENARPYVAFLQNFLEEKNITSVVDVGCGDWQFSRHINWNDIHYIGYDAVESLVACNQKRFGTPSIVFIHADATHSDLPTADLMVCKDVLQHLSNKAVMRLIAQLPKFKYSLLTNDVNSHTLSSDNQDIPIGESRTLDLTQPPFNLAGTKVLTFFGEGMKQVLLIENRGD